MKARNEGVKKLENVEPFNGYHFRSCYYHQLIAGYSHFGVDKKVVLTNYLPLLVYHEKSDTYGFKDIDLITVAETERLTGIRLIVKPNSNNIIDEAIRCIDHDQPILVAVDVYELPYRWDVYQKSHTLHYLLIYGYDLTAKEFIASEHYFSNSNTFRETRIGFELLNTAFREAVERFGNKNPRMLVKMKRTEYRNVLRPPVLTKGYDAEIRASYSVLKRMVRHYIDRYGQEESFFKDFAELPQFFRAYVHRKRIQQFCYDHVLSDLQLFEQISRITENFSFIAGATQKSLSLRRYDEKLIEKIKDRFEEILELEHFVHDALSEFYVKGRRLWK